MGEMFCPNCGHHLEAYRTERQSAGRRDVVLQWMICRYCRHVALKTWTFIDDRESKRGEGSHRLMNAARRHRVRAM